MDLYRICREPNREPSKSKAKGEKRTILMERNGNEKVTEARVWMAMAMGPRVWRPR
jgi:hypothetical protein